MPRCPAKRGAFAYDEALEQLVPQSCPDGVFVDGRVRGVYDLDAQREDGGSPGLRPRTTLVTATARCPRPRRLGEKPPATAIQFSPIRAKRIRGFRRRFAFDGFCQWPQEGYDSVRTAQALQHRGNGPSQGKLSNMNAIGSWPNSTATPSSRPARQPPVPSTSRCRWGIWPAGASTRCDGRRSTIGIASTARSLPTPATGIGPNTMLARCQSRRAHCTGGAAGAVRFGDY